LNIAEVDALVAGVGREESDLIPILQAIQARYHYLPSEALRRIPEVTHIPAAAVAGVARFYTMFRHEPAGKHEVCVCHGTACHVKGSEVVHAALERHLGLEPGRETDPTGTFSVRKVACVGCCTLAPVVVVDSATYGHLTASSAPEMIRDFLTSGAGGAAEAGPLVDEPPEQAGLAEIRVGVGSCCIANGSLKVRDALLTALRADGVPAVVRSVGCVGMCHRTPLVEVVLPSGGRPKAAGSALVLDAREPQASAVYSRVQPSQAATILRRHFRPRGLAGRAKALAAQAADRWLYGAAPEPEAAARLDVRGAPVCAFLGPQVHIATEACGNLGPLDLDGYLEHGGFRALRAALAEAPERVLETVRLSGLRGRGGAGFPTGDKWALVRAARSDVKYVICNGDEGDPGAFMDRMILESYPYRVLEGMAIAAYAAGAHEGFLYIRAEYGLAVRRVREALRRLEARKLLGPGAGDGRWPLTLAVQEGAGAFVCGEETALIASLEGRRGMPRLRPPYPAESGLWGRPTLVNNVETFACVPWILREGAEKFAALGTATSKGTKVFALAGKVRRGGLIEVPMGITIRAIVEEIGGGVEEGRTFKAVQVGGPSGGCIPASLADLPVEYEALGRAGAIMGSGGFVVLDDRDCMVDMARYFLRFTQSQLCGKCTFCRVGTKRLLEILDALCEGRAEAEDLGKLEVLSRQVMQSSLCGLGQTAPNPVLTTLKYFREEYEAHVAGRCPAGRCAALVRYTVTDRCIGCTKCAQVCPVQAIPFTPYRQHVIDDAKCTRCDLCRTTCPEKAIEILPRRG
jgi:NADH-quinone oxidoreductase subunit F